MIDVWFGREEVGLSGLNEEDSICGGEAAAACRFRFLPDL
jgi:hypothetical protein